MYIYTTCTQLFKFYLCICRSLSLSHSHYLSFSLSLSHSPYLSFSLSLSVSITSTNTLNPPTITFQFSADPGDLLLLWPSQEGWSDQHHCRLRWTECHHECRLPDPGPAHFRTRAFACRCASYCWLRLSRGWEELVGSHAEEPRGEDQEAEAGEKGRSRGGQPQDTERDLPLVCLNTDVQTSVLKQSVAPKCPASQKKRGCALELWGIYECGSNKRSYPSQIKP